MKKKLLFLIHTLGGGGAEKALVNLVNNLDSSKYDITVETLFDDGVFVFPSSTTPLTTFKELSILKV